MLPKSAFVAAAVVPPLTRPTATAAQQTAAGVAASGVRSIAADEIDGHLRFLSHDMFQGRAPATRGGELAAQYTPATPRWNRDAELAPARPVVPQVRGALCEAVV